MDDDREMTRQLMRQTVTDVRRARSLGQLDEVAALLELLDAEYDLRRVARTPDPLVTAALADVTTDPAKAIGLYELALAQCKRLPQEPTYEIRLGLAQRMLELGQYSSARDHLLTARGEAAGSGDTAAVERLDTVLQVTAV